MPTSIRLAGVLLASMSLSFLAVLAAPAAESAEPLSNRVLVEQILAASRIDDPAERTRLSAAFESKITALGEEFGKGRPSYRKARRIHRSLHRRYFRHYVETADGLQEILDHGRFNCLSASLFYALVTRAAGFPTQVVETPGHVFVRLHIGKAAHGATLPVLGHEGGGVQLRVSAVRCPFCDSDQTTLESMFGPTRCRMIFYCSACRNTFEHMKKV